MQLTSYDISCRPVQQCSSNFMLVARSVHRGLIGQADRAHLVLSEKGAYLNKFGGVMTVFQTLVCGIR